MPQTNMLDTADSYRLASKLVDYGFHPRVRPSSRNTDGDYQAAIDHYMMDSDFQEMVEAIASGRGARVEKVTDDGILLSAVSADNDNVLKPTDVGARYTQAEERMALGLALVTITSVLYPDEDALRDEPMGTPPFISVSEIHERMVALASRLGDQTQAIGPDLDAQPQSEHAEAWEVVRQKAEMARTRKGNHPRESLYGHIQQAFRLLADQGFVRPESEQDGGTFRPLRRFRTHAALVAAEGTLDAVREASTRLDALQTAETGSDDSPTP